MAALVGAVNFGTDWVLKKETFVRHLCPNISMTVFLNLVSMN